MVYLSSKESTKCASQSSKPLTMMTLYVQHSELGGLHVEGDTFEVFCRNVGDAVADLLEGNSDGD